MNSVFVALHQVCAMGVHQVQQLAVFALRAGVQAHKCSTFFLECLEFALISNGNFGGKYLENGAS